jgi:hypothetical protein
VCSRKTCRNNAHARSRGAGGIFTPRRPLLTVVAIVVQAVTPPSTIAWLWLCSCTCGSVVSSVVVVVQAVFKKSSAAEKKSVTADSGFPPELSIFQNRPPICAESLNCRRAGHACCPLNTDGRLRAVCVVVWGPRDRGRA